jgi:prefoldin subunit 5
MDKRNAEKIENVRREIESIKARRERMDKKRREMNEQIEKLEQTQRLLEEDIATGSKEDDDNYGKANPSGDEYRRSERMGY